MQWETAKPVGFPVCTGHNDCRYVCTMCMYVCMHKCSVIPLVSSAQSSFNLGHPVMHLPPLLIPTVAYNL